MCVCVSPCVWWCGRERERDFVEVSFNFEHERLIICINCMLSKGLGVAAILRKDIREHEKKRKHDPALWRRKKKEEVWIRERVKIGKERVLPCLPVGLNCPGTSLYIIWWIWQWHCCRADLTSSSHLNFIWQELHMLRWCNRLKNNVNVQSVSYSICTERIFCAMLI